jgi:hypothetical protein
VRTIFRRSLDLGSMGAVIEDLDQRGICGETGRLRYRT